MGDTVRERDETFAVRLNSTTVGSLGTATLTGTIINDDQPPIGPQGLFLQLPSRDLITWDSTLGSNGFRYLVNIAPGQSIASVGDFSGDGVADLLFRLSGGGFVSWDVSRGGNGFTELPAFGGFQPVQVGNLMGNFGQDLLLQAPNGQLHIYDAENNSFADLLTLSPGFSLLAVANINGLGTDDYILQNNNTRAVFSLTDQGWRDLFTLSPGWGVVGFGNVTGSAADDFILRNSNTGVTIFWDVEQGGAGFRDFATIGNEWSFKAFADFNGDGRDDVLIQNTNGSAIYWSGSGWVDFGSVLAQAQLVGVSEFG